MKLSPKVIIQGSSLFIPADTHPISHDLTSNPSFLVVDTQLIGKFDSFQRHANWLKNINLAQASSIIVDRYEGNSINIDDLDDAAICKEAVRAFEYIQPDMLDFGPKSKKYVVSFSVTKSWSREKGIAIVKEEFLKTTTGVFHSRMVRHDANEFLNDWWSEILANSPKSGCVHASHLCNQALKVNLSIWSALTLH